MGWTFYNATHYKNGKVDRKAECDAYWEECLNKGHFKVVKSAMHGSVYYGAIKKLVKYSGKTEDGRFIYEPIPEEEQKVHAVVFLTSVKSKEFFNFGYKDMDETMLPYYYDCPKSVLDVLSPTDNDSANEWRKQCRERIASKNDGKSLSKLPVGSIIRYTGNDGKIVELIKQPPAYQFKTAWWLVRGQFKYAKKKDIPENYEVIRFGTEE